MSEWEERYCELSSSLARRWSRIEFNRAKTSARYAHRHGTLSEEGIGGRAWWRAAALWDLKRALQWRDRAHRWKTMR